MGVAVDAWTGYDEIVVETTCLQKDLPAVLRILCARLKSFSFADADFKRERKAVLEEIASADAEVIATRGLFTAAFPQSGYNRDCAGSLDSVSKLNSKDVDWFYATRIRAASLAFVVTGRKSSFDSAVLALNDEFGGLRTSDERRDRASRPYLGETEPGLSIQEQPRTRVRWGKAGGSVLAIGVRGPGVGSRRAAEFIALARALTSMTAENYGSTRGGAICPHLIKSCFGIENAAVHSCVLRYASMLVISLRVRDGKSLQGLAAAVKAVRAAFAEGEHTRPVTVDEPLRLRVLRSLWSTTPKNENDFLGRQRPLSEAAFTVSAVLSPADAPFAGSLFSTVRGALHSFDSGVVKSALAGRSIAIG